MIIKQFFILGGVLKGQYFYKLTGIKTASQSARCNCLKWYQRDINLPPVDTSIPCPSNFFQARLDNRFDFSADSSLLFRTSKIALWNPPNSLGLSKNNIF